MAIEKKSREIVAWKFCFPKWFWTCCYLHTSDKSCLVSGKSSFCHFLSEFYACIAADEWYFIWYLGISELRNVLPKVKVPFSQKRAIYFQRQISYYISCDVKWFQFTVQIIFYRMSDNFKFPNLQRIQYDIWCWK